MPDTPSISSPNILGESTVGIFDSNILATRLDTQERLDSLFSDFNIPKLEPSVPKDISTDDLLTNPTLTSFTVPSSEYTNSTNTKLLLHFNNDLVDDSSIEFLTRQGSGQFASQFTQASLVGKFVGISAALSSQFSQSSVVKKSVDARSAMSSSGFVVTSFGRIRPFIDIEQASFALTLNGTVKSVATVHASSSSSLSCEVTKQIGTITVNANSSSSIFANATKGAVVSASLQSQGFALTSIGRIRPFIDDMVVNSTLEANYNVVKVYSANLSSSATQSADVTKIIGPITANLESVASVVARVVIIPFGNIHMGTTFSQTTNASRIRGISSNVSSDTTCSSIVNIYRRLESSMISSSNLIANAYKIKQFSSQLNAFASELIAINKIGNVLIHASSSSTVSINARINKANSVVIDASASLTCSTKVIKSFRSTSSSSFNIQIIADSGKIAGGSFVSNSQLSVSTKKIASGLSSLQSTVTLTARLTTKKQGISLEMSFGTLNVSAKVIRSSSSNLSSSSSLSAVGGNLKTFTANLQCQGFVLISGKVINLEASSIYIVPKEDRSWIVTEGDNNWYIPIESRSWEIAQEVNEWGIPFENRNYFIKE